MFNASDVNGTQSTSKYEQWYICYQQHIHSLFRSYKQFCKDTHSIVLIDPVKYLVKWVSILNSRNSDDL